MKMKGMLLASLTLLSGAVMLTACSANQRKASDSKTLYLMQTGDILSLDNSNQANLTQWNVLEQSMEGMYRAGKNGKLIPAMATSIVKPTNSGRTYTYHLRKNARWSNGDPVTAQDFVTSWRRSTAPTSKSGYNYIFTGIKNAEQISAGKMPPSSLGVRALSLKEKNNRQDKDADATDNEVKEQVIPNWQEGQHVTLSGCTITEGKTKPKPLHTESTLLAAMETAGKEIEDDTMRQAMKDSGIGTPATRAAIIETLLKREYMVRQQKKLVPTEKGLALHSVVKNMAIANVEMTGKWEAVLAKIERGEASADGFTHSIEGYTREITAELLGCDRLFSHKDSGCQCPKCKQGTMQFFGKVVRCSNKECGMPVFKQVAGKLLTDSDITDLLTKGKTRTLNGFTSKQGKSFSAAIAFDENFNTKFVFAEHKTAEKRGNVKRYKK